MAEAEPRPDRTMRILYITLGFNYGAGKVLRTLISGMTSRGHAVGVVSRCAPWAEWPECPSGVAVYKYDGLARLMPTVSNALRDFSPEVVHGQMLRESALAAVVWRLHGGRMPYLHREPGQLRDRSATGRLAFRMLSKLCTRIASPSAEALSGWATLAPLVRQKGIAIRNAIDIPGDTRPVAETRHDLGVPSDAVMLLNVGSVDDRKNQKMLAAAVASLPEDCRRRLYIVIAGGIHDTGEQDAVISIARDAGIAERVLFTGYRDDMPDIYAASDIAVFASKSESFGVALIEAMAAAKPVISTACGGPNGIVLHEETGLLVPVDDVGAMAVALRALVDDPEMAAAMGRAGLRRARETYSVEAFCDSYEDLYRDMIGECGSRGGGGSA